MSIHFITGKPGGGKTLYAVKLVVDELVYGNRPVYTNVPLNLGALNEYVQREHPSKIIDVAARVWILDEEKTAEFWTYRPGCRIERLTKDEWQAGRKPSYRHVTDQGVFFCIDEVQNFFNARAWVHTGADVLFYLSQHRHLGDTVVCVTQAVMNVDKQFRSVAQDYTFLRNLAKERYGLFRCPAIFLRKTFGEPPGPTAEAMETGTFRLDVSGLASCYSTAAGVGIHARGAADLQERKAGLHWVWFLVGAFVVAYALFMGAPGAVASFFDSGTAPVAKVVSAAPAVVAPVPAPAPPPAAAVVPPGKAVAVPVKEEEKVYLVGVSAFGSKVFVTLSDGRTFRGGDPELEACGRGWARVSGQTYRFK